MTDFKDKNVLAIDTSGVWLRLALSFGGDRLVKSEEKTEQSHGQLVIKKIHELFQSAGMRVTDLNAIVVSTGPGSFTGLRIGLAAAKGIATALNIPIVGVNLFEMAAFKLRYLEHPFKLILSNRRGYYFVAKVDGSAFEATNVILASSEQLGDVIGSDFFAVYEVALPTWPGYDECQDISGRFRFNAADLNYVGREKLSKGVSDDPMNLEPLYLQKSQAEINFDLRNQK